MYLTNSSFFKYDCMPIESAFPLSKLHSVESKIKVEKVLPNAIQGEEVSSDYPQEKNFFKGFLYAIPPCILFWVVFICAVRELLI